MKKLLLSLSSILCFLPAIGQNLHEHARVTNPIFSKWNDVVALDSSTFFLVGEYASNTNSQLEPGNLQIASSNEKRNALIARMRNGRLDTVIGFGGDGYERAYKAALDSMGNLYVIGHFYEELRIGNLSIQSKGENDQFLLKLSPSLQALWIRQLGGREKDAGLALSVDEQGNVYTAAFTLGTVYFGPNDSLVATKNYRMQTLCKWSPNGQLLAHRFDTIGNSTSSSEPLSLATHQGKVAVGGFHAGPGQFQGLARNASGQMDGYVQILDTALNQQSVHFVTSAGADFVWALGFDALGNLNLGGSFQGRLFWGNQRYSAIGPLGAFVAQLDANGNPTWFLSGGGAGLDQVNSLKVSPEGAIYAAGQFASSAIFDTLNMSGFGSDESFVMKVNAHGKPLWGRVSKCSNGDAAVGLDLWQGSDSNSVVMVGSAKGSLVWDFSNIGNNNVDWSYMVHLKEPKPSTTDLTWFEAAEPLLSVRPNPSHEVIEVDLPKEVAFLQIENLSGQILMEQAIPDSMTKTNFAVEKLPTGLYLIRAMDKEKKQVGFGKFIKE